MTSIELDGKIVLIHGGVPGEDRARWTISYRMLQAHVHVPHDAIAGSVWADEYFDRRRALVANNGHGGSETLARWKALSRCIVSPCLSMLETLKPAKKTPWTLADYCLAATVSVRIVRAVSSSNANDDGVDVDVELVSGPHPSPAYGTSPVPALALHHQPATLPRFAASELLVAKEDAAKTCLAAPHRVWTAGDSGRLLLFFKPCMANRETEFAREVDVLARIGEARLYEQINVAHMAGVVTTEDGAAVLGVLLRWIGGAPLAAEAARVEMHGEWREVVRGIVGTLHEHGIVWGDANPHNIIIDDQLVPWVVDFGGLCNAEFVDEQNTETAKGDWQGFHKIFDYWLPATAASLGH